jgi:hypothetical protein
MKKKRHSWGKVETNKADFNYQKCVNCDLYRISALGIWQYTKDNPKTLYVDVCKNEGCDSIKIFDWWGKLEQKQQLIEFWIDAKGKESKSIHYTDVSNEQIIDIHKNIINYINQN